MTDAINVAILGGAGYGAGELLRLLTAHPAARVVCVVSGSAPGRTVADVHPHLRAFYDLHLSTALEIDALRSGGGAVVLFAALPHGSSAAAIQSALDSLDRAGLADRARIIDLSGDLRLADHDLHRAHYPESPLAPDLRRRFVYGMPELARAQITAARCVANPGCLASAAILALAPLARAGLSGPVAIDANTGSSGSGRQLKDITHHPTRHADFRAYKALAHQHEPEVLAALGDPCGRRIAASFVAHSMDTARGIFVTAHATLAEPAETTALRKSYETFYADSPFVRVREDSPALQNVVGSNFCDVSVTCRGRQVVAMAALDNLVKGMAGTAIQNMNLMCGLPETTGLWQPALRPI